MKYCIKHNNGQSLCVCKHKPCMALQQIVEIADKLRTKTDYYSEAEVNNDIEQIQKLAGEILRKEID